MKSVINEVKEATEDSNTESLAISTTPLPAADGTGSVPPDALDIAAGPRGFHCAKISAQRRTVDLPRAFDRSTCSKFALDAWRSQASPSK